MNYYRFITGFARKSGRGGHPDYYRFITGFARKRHRGGVRPRYYYRFCTKIDQGEGL